MKTLSRMVPVWLVLVFMLVTARGVSAEPFVMNGWQFHERNLPKLAEAIKKAPEYGVNFFIFSHDLFDHVEEFLSSPERQHDVLQAGAWADQQKIPWYLWAHEFDDVPAQFRIKTDVSPDDARASVAAGSSSFRLGNRVNMDDPGLVPYLRDRYERLLAKCPTAAGLVLTLHESDNKVFRNAEVQSKLTVPERIYLVATVVYDVVVTKHHKKLILRNFFYEPWEMDAFAQVIPRLPDDIILMSKDTIHEFDPWYPPDPQHGKGGKKLYIMEPDLGVEKAWGKEGHYAQVAYIKRYMQRARDTKMAGAVGRARLMWDHPFEDSHEINLYAFSRFMKDPDADVDAVFKDWAARRYSAEAAPYVASAMKRTESIQHHGRWFLGFWLTKSIGDEWGDYPYYFGHILLRSRYKWTQTPEDKALEEGLYSPDAALFAKLVAEKEDVIKEVRASLADINMAARYLTPEQAGPLRDGFRYLLDAAELQKEWTRAFFAMRMWMKTQSVEQEMIVRDALAKLEAMDRLPDVPYGRSAATGHRYNIDKFVLEMQWRLANRARALEEDARILEHTRRLSQADAS
jgi:hypothetical protein